MDLILWRAAFEEVWRNVYDVFLLADVRSCTLLGCVPYLLPFFFGRIDLAEHTMLWVIANCHIPQGAPLKDSNSEGLRMNAVSKQPDCSEVGSVGQVR